VSIIGSLHHNATVLEFILWLRYYLPSVLKMETVCFCETLAFMDECQGAKTQNSNIIILFAVKTSTLLLVK
jgi:hypothetical protein